MVSDHGAVLFFPGVIHGDAAAAEIHAFAHVRITHISQVNKEGWVLRKKPYKGMK